MFIALAVLVIYYVLIEVCILYSSIKKEALSSLLTANVLPRSDWYFVGIYLKIVFQQIILLFRLLICFYNFIQTYKVHTFSFLFFQVWYYLCKQNNLFVFICQYIEEFNIHHAIHIIYRGDYDLQIFCLRT